MSLKSALKRLAPSGALTAYHWLFAWLAGLRYGFPSRRLIVIGVTGTNGKSTTCHLIAKVLEAGGHKVGLATTVGFKVADREWLNDRKMTMLGRSQLQRLLNEMVRAGCRYAVIETSSEGIRQFRHSAINYDLCVFTNLTPEHLESHGGFENYKRAKGELFRHLGRSRPKYGLLEDSEARLEKLALVNVNDPQAEYFLSFGGYRRWGWLVGEPGDSSPLSTSRSGQATVGGFALDRLMQATDVQLADHGSDFNLEGMPYRLKLIGGFNVENALAAASVGLALGITHEQAAKALAGIEAVPGRLESIDEGQDFSVIVDYAPEPESFRKLYDAVRLMDGVNRIIHVLGSCGGGRDRDRRPVLGHLAAEKADVVIVTDEDPYDDDPMEIIREVAAGAREGGKREGESLYLIADRREALRRAVSLARPGDLVLATGKGAEQYICRAEGAKQPWDEREELRQAILLNRKP